MTGRRFAFVICAIVGLSVCGLGACTPIGVLTSAGAEAGLAALDPRGMDGVLSDKTMELSIAESLFTADRKLFGGVEVAVYEGRVLLAGTVSSADHMARILRLVEQERGVRTVLNEMEIARDGDLVDTGRDAWIGARLRSRLVLDDRIDSVNFSVETVNRSVFVMGIARNARERDRVIGHARQIHYVKRVVDLTRVASAAAPPATQTSSLRP